MMFKRVLILTLFIASCTFKAPTEFSKNALSEHFFTVDNKAVQLKEILEAFKGEKVLINVWASWCKDCIVAIPKMKELQANNPNVNYVFISSDRNVYAWKKTLKNVSGSSFLIKNEPNFIL